MKSTKWTREVYDKTNISRRILGTISLFHSAYWEKYPFEKNFQLPSSDMKLWITFFVPRNTSNRRIKIEPFYFRGKKNTKYTSSEYKETKEKVFSIRMKLSFRFAKRIATSRRYSIITFNVIYLRWNSSRFYGRCADLALIFDVRF